MTNSHALFAISNPLLLIIYSALKHFKPAPAPKTQYPEAKEPF
jgi:hypothetical protein